ncbi:hypothetical protein RRG08_003537 [Elysia crispata]|uniref:Uncharacterized protein n=1 Tax=Elysia crispata TaxID=231223 RepID=A0AAE0Y7J8_9GAST|nr:hypothetical protein RRG08_003537 [Elysia crispata]
MTDWRSVDENVWAEQANRKEEEPYDMKKKKRAARLRQKIPADIFSPPLPPPCLFNTCLVGVVRGSQRGTCAEDAERSRCLFAATGRERAGCLSLCVCVCVGGGDWQIRPPRSSVISLSFLLEDSEGSDGAAQDGTDRRMQS